LPSGTPTASYNTETNFKCFFLPITLISSSSPRLTSPQKSFFRLPHYITYHTNHPVGTARGGTAILIKNSIQHHLLNPYSQDYLEATSAALEGPHDLITISAVYLPTKHTITHEILTAFYATLGHRFLAGGDYNAKHIDWRSRLTSPRGRVIAKTKLRKTNDRPDLSSEGAHHKDKPANFRKQPSDRK
jgi:hypothetical protein